MKTLEQLYDQAIRNGEAEEAARLLRLMERLDEQRAAYGLAQREG